MDRRDFIKYGGAGMLGTLAAAGRADVAKKSGADKRRLAVLLHLGLNMWDDFGSEGPDGRAKSADELKKRPNPLAPNGKPSRYTSFLRTDDASWRKSVDGAAAAGMNMVIVDLGEAVRYPSHPELAVAGSWSADKLRDELRRMRGLGLEPIPKLNFSSVHDAWLKWYHAMLSTPKYYEVVSDLIRDVCEMFDRPGYFHLGWDEESSAMFDRCFRMDVRQGELWWHDFDFTLKEAAKRGARPVVFPDRLWWHGPEDFLRHASKEPVYQNWHYRTAKDESLDLARMKKVEKWVDTKTNSAASFRWLDEHGFDQFPCVSNCYDESSVDYVVAHCRKVIADERLFGFCMASWRDCCGEAGVRFNNRGNELLMESYRRHYGGVRA